MIIINNQFVYIHHPKTGGTFVTEMLRKIASETDGFVINEIPGLKHAGIKKIPEQYRNLPVVINVRNVFEHYVSRYTFRWWAEPAHAKKRFDMEKVYKEFPDFPDLGFSEFLRLFNMWSLRRTIAKKKVEKFIRHDVGYNSSVLARLTLDNPIKLYENLDDMKEDNLNDMFRGIRFLRTENLNADLHRLLKDYGVKKEKIDPILESPPILPKKGGRGIQQKTWGSYFTQDDIDLVRQKDRLYFKLFPDMDSRL